MRANQQLTFWLLFLCSSAALAKLPSGFSIKQLEGTVANTEHYLAGQRKKLAQLQRLYAGLFDDREMTVRQKRDDSKHVRAGFAPNAASALRRWVVDFLDSEFRLKNQRGFEHSLRGYRSAGVVPAYAERNAWAALVDENGIEVKAGTARVADMGQLPALRVLYFGELVFAVVPYFGVEERGGAYNSKAPAQQEIFLHSIINSLRDGLQERLRDKSDNGILLDPVKHRNLARKIDFISRIEAAHEAIELFDEIAETTKALNAELSTTRQALRRQARDIDALLKRCERLAVAAK